MRSSDRAFPSLLTKPAGGDHPSSLTDNEGGTDAPEIQMFHKLVPHRATVLSLQTQTLIRGAETMGKPVPLTDPRNALHDLREYFEQKRNLALRNKAEVDAKATEGEAFLIADLLEREAECYNHATEMAATYMERSVLNIIVGQRDGKLWKFHWDGKTMTPFTKAEMEKEGEASEKRAADIFNSGLDEPEMLTPERSEVYLRQALTSVRLAPAYEAAVDKGVAAGRAQYPDAMPNHQLRVARATALKELATFLGWDIV